MSFLVQADFREVIKNDLLEQIIEDHTASLTESTETAIEEMASYLSSRYNVEQIFNKTGDDRHKLMVLFGIDIALYHLHARIDPIQVPDIRKDRYKNATDSLKMIASGEMNPVGLPPLFDEEGNVETGSKFGSDRPFITKY